MAQEYTMVPSGITIAGWNDNSLAPTFALDPVQVGIVTKDVSNWDAIPQIGDTGAQFLISPITNNYLFFTTGEVPGTLMTISGDPNGAIGASIVMGEILLEDCANVAQGVLGAITIGDCGVTFNGGVFPAIAFQAEMNFFAALLASLDAALPSSEQPRRCVAEILKHPDSIVDIRLDWAGWLAADDDLLVSVSVSNDPGLVVASTAITSTATVTRISGGTAGISYYVTVTVLTQLGRIEARTVLVIVRDRR